MGFSLSLLSYYLFIFFICLRLYVCTRRCVKRATVSCAFVCICVSAVYAHTSFRLHCSSRACMCVEGSFPAWTGRDPCVNQQGPRHPPSPAGNRESVLLFSLRHILALHDDPSNLLTSPSP